MTKVVLSTHNIGRVLAGRLTDGLAINYNYAPSFSNIKPTCHGMTYPTCSSVNIYKCTEGNQLPNTKTILDF